MDRTGEAVRRQIAAMGCRAFEIGLFRANATMILLTFDADSVLKWLPRFRFENCQGGNVFIRPDGEHNLTMVDDLNVESIRRMKVMDLSPALVVENVAEEFSGVDQTFAGAAEGTEHGGCSKLGEGFRR